MLFYCTAIFVLSRLFGTHMIETKVQKYYHVLVCGEILGGGDIYLRSRKVLAAIEMQIGDESRLVLALPPGGIIILTKEQYTNPLYFYKIDEVEKSMEHSDLLVLLESTLKLFVSVEMVTE